MRIFPCLLLLALPLMACSKKAEPIDSYKCDHKKVQKELFTQVQNLKESRDSGLQVLYLHRFEEISWDASGQERQCRGILKTNRKKLKRVKYLIQSSSNGPFQLELQ